MIERGLFGAIVLLMGISQSQAQLVKDQDGRKKKGLQLQLFPDAPKPRSNSPIGLEAQFSGLDPGKLVEGRLRVALRESGGVLAVWESPELAISSGEISFRFMLPGATTQGFNANGNAHCTLLTKDRKTIDFGVFSFPLPTDEGRNVSVAMVYPEIGAYNRLNELQGMLTLRRYDPEKKDNVNGIDTSVAYIKPGSIGVQAMEFCPYEVLVLAGNGLTLLKEKQLAAIVTWVKAGGSLLVVPSTAVKDEHLRVLNELTADDYALDDQGMLVEQARGLIPAHHRYRPGLGRLAVVYPLSDEDRKEADQDSLNAKWQRTVAHLYKFQQKQVAIMGRKAEWSATGESLQGWRGQHYGAREYVRSNMNRLQLQPLSGHVGGMLAEYLLPRDMRLVPGWAIFLVLFIFVLVIGPLDYIILGKLRKRKYTWILFPLMSILFTIFMVKMAEHFMGTNDHRKTLRVVDVDVDGTVLRENKLTMYFTAKHKQMTEKGDGGMISLVKHEGVSSFADQYSGSGMMGGMDDYKSGGEIYVGRLPGAYAFNHSVKQWTPTLVREMQFDAGELPVPGFWSSLVVAKDLKQQCQDASKQYPGRIILVKGGKSKPQGWGSGPSLSDEIIGHLSARFSIGWFSVVSAVSPNGGSNFEDMSLLDLSDPGSYVVAALEERDGEIILYRCLYQGDES